MNLLRTSRLYLLACGLACAVCNYAQTSQQKPAQQQPAPPAQPKTGNDANPFPEDTSSVPVVGINPATVTDAAPVPALQPEADPVRSPDGPDTDSSSSDGFSSSQSALAHMPQPDEGTVTGEKAPGLLNRGAKPKPAEHTETAAEDESVGSYYLTTRNWKAALSRFQSALVLDPENPDVYWGLAEAQRHLGDLASAKTNYAKVVEYDPDSKHAREAKRLLAGSELANAGQPK